jgi:hypothetical protein
MNEREGRRHEDRRAGRAKMKGRGRRKQEEEETRRGRVREE